MFNHDAFITNQNYTDLDASLAWYISAVQSKLDVLEKLARHNPIKARALYQRDPVMKKIHRIDRALDRFKSAARAER